LLPGLKRGSSLPAAAGSGGRQNGGNQTAGSPLVHTGGIAAIPREKEAIRMFRWFQGLVSIRYQELSQLRRELRRGADK